MNKLIKKNLNLIYIAVVYILILIQYPVSMAIFELTMHQNLGTSLEPGHLLLWGAIRIILVIPLLFTLLSRDGIRGEDIYLSFGNYRKVINIAFWGTFFFTLLGLALYPSFINQTTLGVGNFLRYLPIFMLYAITNAFIEETFFRGISIHYLMDKMPFWVANIVQALFFCVIHIISPMTSTPWLFVALTFFLGLLWGLLTKRTKSLVPAVSLHVIADIFVAISLF